MDTCDKCGAKAVWILMSGPGVACDDCVPRGCSCNMEPNEGLNPDSEEWKNPANWHEPLDHKGRRKPCCEWWQIDEELTNVNSGEKKTVFDILLG